MPTPSDASTDDRCRRSLSAATVFVALAGVIYVCASRKYRHGSGRRHFSACVHYWLFSRVPSDFTGTIADNRHYIEGPLRHPTPEVQQKVSGLLYREGFNFSPGTWPRRRSSAQSDQHLYALVLNKSTRKISIVTDSPKLEEPNRSEQFGPKDAAPTVGRLCPPSFSRKWGQKNILGGVLLCVIYGSYFHLQPALGGCS